MNRVKLSYKSYDDLNNLRMLIENNPANRMTGGSFYLYKPSTRKNLADIAWAVTLKLARDKQPAI